MTVARSPRDSVPMRRLARTGAIIFGYAAWTTACGGGISLDPSTSNPTNKDKGDATDALEGGAPDASLDPISTQDGNEELEVSAPLPDVPEESRADATDPIGADAKLDGDRDDLPDMSWDGDGGSDGGLADVYDDWADGLVDAAAEPGDGCTLACGWPDADYYVDAHASSDGDGSRFEPFRTITRAIAVYRETSGQAKSVFVAAGTYDRALGEQFPLVLRGLSLKGAGRDVTSIVGSGSLDHGAEGGAFHDQYLVTLQAGDGLLKTAISDVSVRSESPVPTLNYYGVFCDRGSATGEVAAPAGQTELERVSIGPGYHASVLATTSTLPAVTGCNIVIRSSALTGGWAGLRAYGCDPTRLSAPVLVEMGGADPTSGNVVSWMQAPNDAAAGASLEGCVPRASFQNNTFVDSSYGLSINVPLGTAAPRPVTIKHNSFERLRAGGIITTGNGTQVDELSDNRFVGITRALTQDPGARAIAVSIGLLQLGKVRRNEFIGNDFGMLLGVPAAAGQPADLGTVGDPGNNVFRCNSALKETGADLAFSGDTSNVDGNWGGTIDLAGNAWDHAPPTLLTDDPIPNGCDISTIRVPHVTLDLQNSSLATPVCPMDRVPGR